MRPIYVFFGLMLLFTSQFAAFDMGDYLYSSESMSSVTQETLSTSGAIGHTIYYVNGIPTVLTAGDTPLEDFNSIEAILSEHYTNTVLPSEAELSEIRADLLKFNSSRNFMLSRFGGGAEDLCMQETLLGLYDCKSSMDCLAATMKCFLADQNGVSGCYRETMSPLYYDYNTQIEIFKKNVPEIFELLDSLDVSNAHDNLNGVKQMIAELQTASVAIENNNLGGLDGPVKRESIGLCSVSHLDKNALSSAETKISTLQSSLSSLSELSTTATTLMDNTATRANYKKGSTLLKVWKPKWTSFKEKNSELRGSATEFATFVKDSEFTISFKKFDTAWESMETRMSSLDFEGAERDMSNLQDSAKIVSQYINSQEEHPFKTAVNLANDATDAIIYAKYNVRTDDAASVEAYNLLAKKKNEIDSKLNPPMTSSQYEQIAGEYKALTDESNMFVQSQIHIEDSISSAGGAFGQTAIGAVFALTDALYALPPSQKESVAPAIPPVVLFLIDLAAVSVLLVAFIAISVKFKHMFKKRAILGVWVALLLTFLFVIGAGSVLMFILIDQSAQSATIQEFASVLSNANSVYIIVNDAPANSLASMTSCAKNISGQITAEYGTPAQVFELSGSTCKYDGQSLTSQECLDIAGANPVMNLYYDSSKPSAKFFVVYQKRAEISGDLAYYQRCEIGDVLH